MPKILALDSSTAACSVALNLDGEICEDFVLAPQDHTKRLLPMIDALLTVKGVSLQELDAIAFARGPGSFTGLRIAVGVVQGLAFGAGLRVIPLSTLQIMAASAMRLLEGVGDALLCPVLDARMGEVYWGLYESSLLCAEGDRVDSPDQMAALLEEHALSGREVFLVGEGFDLLQRSQLLPAGTRGHAELYPHAHDAALMAAERFAAGATEAAMDAAPVYIRNEVSWKKRTRIRS